MKIEDLKTGMYVYVHNAWFTFYSNALPMDNIRDYEQKVGSIDYYLVAHTGNSWSSVLSNYSKDTHLSATKVQEVREPYARYQLPDAKRFSSILWELPGAEEETKEMTVADIEKELGYSVKVVK